MGGGNQNAKVIIVKKTVVSAVKTENSEERVLHRVTHSHWGLELVPISLEVRVR